MLTDYQRAVLAHVVVDPDAWLSHAVAELGEGEATKALDAKVTRVAQAYEAAVAAEGTAYRTRAQRDAEASGPGHSVT